MDDRGLGEKIIESLLIKGIVSEKEASELKEKNILGLEEYLISHHLLSVRKLNEILSDITGAPAIDPNMVSIDKDFIPRIRDIVPYELALRYRIFPIKYEENFLHLVMGNPTDRATLNTLMALTGCRIRPYSCSIPSIIKAIEDNYIVEKAVEKRKVEVVEKSTDILVEETVKVIHQLQDELYERGDALKKIVNHASVVQLLQHMFNEVIKLGISDVHFEPLEDEFRVRIRKDGILRTRWSFPPVLKFAIVPRIKMMANLDLQEQSVPQDGRIDYPIIVDKDIDTRISILPSLHGEKAVLRILDKEKIHVELDQLGFEPDDLEKIKKAVDAPNGMILVTGPTGSGKTTTLYAALNRLNTEEKNIVTAEDPIEYELPGVIQTECKPERGFTFAQAIRSFLRQDPDIIMVGEIRDQETADIAIKSSLTGHLVLSTLHTNDAPGTVTRLLNMDIPPYLVSSALLLVIAQRLLRKICPRCKEEIVPDPRLLRQLNLTEEDLQNKIFFKGKGCEECLHTGYQGRTAIVELLEISEPIESLILSQASSGEIRRTAVELGMKTLRRAGLEKVFKGITTLEEVLRVTIER